MFRAKGSLAPAGIKHRPCPPPHRRERGGPSQVKKEKTKTDRGRGAKKGQSPESEEKTLTPERMERGELSDSGLGRDDGMLSLDSGGMQTFHFVMVLDLPDPSSSASGNISKYFDTVYEQIAFNVTAVLYQEQITSGYVDKECDALSSLRDDFANRGVCLRSS